MVPFGKERGMGEKKRLYCIYNTDIILTNGGCEKAKEK